MPIRIECPSCSAVLALPDSVQGKTVKVTCKKCGEAFTTGSKAVPSGMREGKPKSATAPVRRRPMEDDEDRDIDTPPSRGRRDDRDEAPSRKRRPAEKPGGANWWLIGGLIGGLGAIAAGVVLFFVLQKPKSPEEELAEALKNELEKELKGGFPKIDFKIDPKGFPTLPPPKVEIPPIKFDPTIPVDKKDPLPPEKKEAPPAREPITVKLEGGARHMALSPDGKLLAIAWNILDKSGLQLFQYPELTVKYEWKIEVSGNRSLGFSPDGKTLYALRTSVFDPAEVKGFDTSSGKELGVIFKLSSKFGGDVLATSRDGSLIGAGSKQGYTLWNTVTKTELASFKPQEEPKKNFSFFYDSLFGPDNQFLYAVTLWGGGDSKGQIRLWDNIAKTEKVLIGELPGEMRRMLQTRDGSKLLAIYHNTRDGGGVACWDREGKQLWFWKCPNASGFMWTMSLSPDEKLLAIGGNSSTIRILDMADGKTLGGFQKAGFGVQDVLFPEAGKLISTGDRAIRLWDLADMRPVDVPKDDTTIAKGDPTKGDPTKDPKKDVTPPPMPKGPEVVDFRNATYRDGTGKGFILIADGKPVAVDSNDETKLFDQNGNLVSKSHPMAFFLLAQGNVVDVKVRTESGKAPLALEYRLVRPVAEIPIRSGSIELKAARIKEYRNKAAVIIGADGKEFTSHIHHHSLCFDQTGKCLDTKDALRIFKVGNTMDVWIFPLNKDTLSVNVAKLQTGNLMTDAELGAKAPEFAKTEKKTGRIRVYNRGGKTEFGASFSVKLPGKKTGVMNVTLQTDRDPRAFDMDGKAVPWQMIFHPTNEVELTMEVRGVIHTVLEARLVKGVVK